MRPRTLSSSHSQRAESGGRMSFMPLTALSLSAMRTPGSDRLGLPVFFLDVALDDLVEFGGDVLAAQREGLLAVDEHGRRRRLSGAGQADADVGMLALAGAVDDAAHDRDAQLLHARVLVAPHRHVRTQV